MKTLKDIPKNGASSEYSGDWSINYDDLKDVAKEWISYFESEVDKKLKELETTSDELTKNSCRMNILGYKMARTAFIKFFNLDVEDEEKKQEDSN